MKTKILFPIAVIMLLLSACNGDKKANNDTKINDDKVKNEVSITKQFFVTYEANGEEVIMQSDDASCGYVYTNSEARYNVDMAFEFGTDDDLLKQVNFSFYIDDKSKLNAEELVGNSFPARLNIFHRDLSKKSGEQFVYQMSTDFVFDAEQTCTFDSFEQIGDSRYYLATGTFSCTLSNMDETETLTITKGKFAMKVKP